MSEKATVNSLIEQAEAFADAGQFMDAAECYQQAAVMAGELGDWNIQSQAVGNIGICFFRAGGLSQATDCFNLALSLVRRHGNPEFEEFIMDNLAIAYDAAGLHAKATMLLRDALERAQANGHRVNEMNLYGHLGNVLALNGNLQDAVANYTSALRIANKLGDRRSAGVWAGFLGKNTLSMKQYAEAADWFRQAVEHSEAAGDLGNKETWGKLLREAEGKRASASKPTLARPSAQAGAFAFSGLAVRVSQIPDIVRKQQLIASERSAIQQTILEALDGDDPAHTLALIDCATSMLTRELAFRRRCEMGGIPAPDAVLHGFDPGQVLRPICEEPGLATVTFYYTPQRSFFAFLTFLRDRRPVVEKVPLATGRAGENLHQTLLLLAEKRRQTPFDNHDRILLEIVSFLGRAILPRLARIEGLKKILLIPYKLLHLAPLHAMFDTENPKSCFIDALGVPTYSSSLCNYHLRGKVGAAAPGRRQVFAFIDTRHLAKYVFLEVQVYEEMRDVLAKANLDPHSVTIITDPTTIPANLGVYQAIAWSGHASSNPTNWEESHLAFGAAKITAKQILQEWRLANTCVAILSACETGIDKSIDDEIDDYLGIDMAVHVAGANTVVSTMWPVEDHLAGLVSAFLAEGVVKHSVPPAEFLRQIRFDLMSGEWKAKVESNYAALTSEQKRIHAARFSMLLEADKDAFRNIAAWGVYRTFGG